MKKKKEETDIYKEIGERLRSARERIGFSLLHVSGVFGIGYQSLRRYENGETAIPIDLLFELAKYYGSAPADLLPDEDDVKKKKLNDKAQLEKNIFLVKKIFESDNEKAKRITSAAIDFLNELSKNL